MSEIVSINAIQLRVAARAMKLSLLSRGTRGETEVKERTAVAPAIEFPRILKDAEEVEEIRFTSTGG